MRALTLNAEYCPKQPHVHGGFAPASESWRRPVVAFEERPTPQVSSPFDMILEPIVVGICGSDAHMTETGRDGYVRFGGPARLPVILGHEFSGRVLDVGCAVHSFKAGDVVAAESISACFDCKECDAGHYNECVRCELLGLTRDGALAPFVRVDARHCFSIDDLLDRYGYATGCELGALLEPLGVAYRGLLLKAQVTATDVVAVFGAGPIGLAIVLLARWCRATVVVFEKLPVRLELARRLGAYVLDYESLRQQGVRPADAVRTLTGGRDATLAVEAAGDMDAFEACLAVLGNRGRMLQLGRLPGNPVVGMNTVMTKSITILGSRGHSGYDIFPRLIELAATDAIDAAAIITARVRFESAALAIEQAKSGRDGKILVTDIG